MFFSQAILEVWKFDIEFGEYEVLQHVVRSGLLRQVKQVAFELHTRYFHLVGAGLYMTIYEALLELERQGFRKFRSRQNPVAPFLNPRTGKMNNGCCFEVNYINLRFLAQKLNKTTVKPPV